MRRRSIAFLVGLGLVSAGGAADAQAQVEVERYQKQLEQIQLDTRMHIDADIPTDQRMLVEYGGYATYNFVSIDGIGSGTHVLQEYDLGAYAHVNLDGAQDFFFRGHTSYKMWDPGESLDGNNYFWVQPTIDRAIYRFDLQRAMNAYEGKNIGFDVALTGGRQLVQWANGLVLSEEIDGALVDLSYGPAKLEFLAGISTPKQVNFDTSRPDFRHTDRGFYGALLNIDATPVFKPFAYGLVQLDYKNDPTVTAGSTTNFHYDSYYMGAGASGALGDHFRYSLEIAYEGGGTDSSGIDPATGNPVTQTYDSISAGAGDFQADYLFNDARRTRLSSEVILASGDVDRGTTSNTIAGNSPNTHDHAFNAFGALNTGLAFAPHVSNIMAYRVGTSAFPLPGNDLLRRLQVGMDFLAFGKLNAAAPIDEPTTGDAFLGVEPDLYVNWEITSDVSLAVRYGVFFPGNGIATGHAARNFVYTGLTFTF